MTNDANKPGGSSGASPAELQKTVDEMSRLLHEAKATQSAMRAQTLVGTLVIVVIMLTFGGLLYTKMRENLTKDKLSTALMEKGQLLVPQVEQQIRATLNEVAPIYAKMGKERLAAVSPKLQSRLKAEADRLPAQLQERLNKDIDARFEATTKHAVDELHKAFPTMTGAEGDKAADRLKEALTNEGAKVRDHVKTIYEGELAKVHEVMDKFPLPDVSQTTSDVLEARLLHSLIMLVDYQLLGSDSPPPPESGTPSTSSSR